MIHNLRKNIINGISQNNPFGVTFDRISKIEIERNKEEKSYSVACYFKDFSDFNEELLKQNISEAYKLWSDEETKNNYTISQSQKYVMLKQWKYGYQLHLEWLSYLVEKSENNVYQAQIDLVALWSEEMIKNKEEEILIKVDKAMKLPKIVLTPSQNQALSRIANSLIHNDAIYYMDEDKINYDKVFVYLIIYALNTFSSESHNDLIELVAKTQAKEISSLVMDYLDDLKKQIQDKDEAISKLNNYNKMLMNQLMLIMRLLIEYNGFNGLNQNAKNTILDVLKNPIIDGTDKFNLLSGNEYINEFLDKNYNDLYDTSPKNINVEVEKNPDVIDSEIEEVDDEDTSLTDEEENW